jgi:uncharacterized protein YndB with AHSA1/START domain
MSKEPARTSFMFKGTKGHERKVEGEIIEVRNNNELVILVQENANPFTAKKFLKRLEDCGK